MLSKGKVFGLFLLVCTLLLAAVIWFIPAPAIKGGIETYGSEQAGAKVEKDELSRV